MSRVFTVAGSGSRAIKSCLPLHSDAKISLHLRVLAFLSGRAGLMKEDAVKIDPRSSCSVSVAKKKLRRRAATQAFVTGIRIPLRPSWYEPLLSY